MAKRLYKSINIVVLTVYHSVFLKYSIQKIPTWCIITSNQCNKLVTNYCYSVIAKIRLNASDKET